jgi:uncharacterized Zn finger protein
MSWYQFQPYVPVERRRAEAQQQAAKREKRGEKLEPVYIKGSAIATTFWGKAWCKNLESYSDFSNRLPRGRTYVRHGAVIDLKMEKGKIKALVSGSEVYKIQIEIEPLSDAHWSAIKKQCTGKIGTLIELLQGKLSKEVMEVVTHRDNGLFPKPKEIKMRCSCPDYAGMCKHLAAVLYGVGNRLDTSPGLLFTLRGVDQAELIKQAIPTTPPKSKATPTIANGDLGSIFGIEIDDSATVEVATTKSVKKMPAKVAKKMVKPPTKKKTQLAKPKPRSKPLPKKG